MLDLTSSNLLFWATLCQASSAVMGKSFFKFSEQMGLISSPAKFVRLFLDTCENYRMVLNSCCLLSDLCKSSFLWIEQRANLD